MTTQKTYVDYKNLGDTGTATAASIQPITDGEAAVAATFGRPAENLRSRTEIARDTFGDLLYYRDRTSRYLIELGAGGSLVWEAGGVGTGIVNNTTQLTLRPFVTPRTNQKGVLHVGTNAVNRVSYTVAATAYATDGMNEITVEHRSVTGTVTPTVTISSGPVYRILVVFDSAVATHNSATVTGLVNTAIAGVAALTGKISAINNGATGTAIATLAETPIDTRTHAAGTAGNATADVEAHTLAANALSTFTTSNPLAEGDLLAIRYDYVIEPSAGDSNDPKGGVRGGRAESNQSRSNSDVSANLFIAQAHPEWLPGCIPLCKVVNGSLHWVDGSVFATGSSGMPGSSLSSYVNSSAWAGSPTLIVGGGISNAAATDTPQEALDSVNQRLGQLRSVTWTVSDNTLSTGGHYNGATQVDAAIAATQSASMYGGVVYLRRGNYTNVFANGSMTVNGLTLRGETYDVTLTLGATNTYANTLPVVMENVALQRSAAYVLTLAGDVRMQNVRANPGMLKLGTTSTANVRLDRLVMVAAGVSAATTYGISFEGKTVHATNCDFVGPDTLVSSGGSVVNFGQNVQSAVFDNCTFSMQNANTLISFTSPGANTAAQGIVFRKCTFTGGTSTSYLLNLVTAVTNGRITFEDCQVTNTTHSPIATITGWPFVTFVRTEFTTGTTCVSGTTTGNNAFRAYSSSATGMVQFTDVSFNIGQVDSGANVAGNIPFVCLGDDPNTPQQLAGMSRVSTRGLQINLLSTVTNLPTASLLSIQTAGSLSDVAGRHSEITLNLNAKTFTVNAQPGPLLWLGGGVDPVYSRPQRIEVDGVTFARATGAAVAATGTYLGTQYALLRRLYTYAVQGVPATQYTSNQYQFGAGTQVETAFVAVFGSTVPPITLSGTNSAETRCQMTGLRVTGVFGTPGSDILRVSDAMVADSQIVSTSTGQPTVALVTRATITNSRVEGATNSTEVVRLSGDRLSITSCRVYNTGTAATVIDAAGVVAHACVVSNTLAHSSGSTPAVGTNVSSGTGAVVSNNVLIVGTV